MEFKEIVEKRYATQKFTGENIAQEKIDKLLHLIRYSASSFGLQPYRIHIITNDELKEKLKPTAYGQEQITTSSHLLVFCAYSDTDTRIDQYETLMQEQEIAEERIHRYTQSMRKSMKNKSKEEKTTWAQRQVYIAVGNAINGAKALGFDSCPMEGFDPEQYKEILSLPEEEHPTVLVTVGIAADTPRKKIRYKSEQLFEWHT